jgi:flagellar biosynthesis/type III secretory pathway M-ring protein FliF/YscJ
VLAALLTLLLLAAVIVIVAAPLRARRRAALAPDERDGGAERAELESAREAKYREIRDTELDYRTGKLSREDYEAVDAALRAEALAILDALAREGAERDGAEREERA